MTERCVLLFDPNCHGKLFRVLDFEDFEYVVPMVICQLCVRLFLIFHTHLEGCSMGNILEMSL